MLYCLSPIQNTFEYKVDICMMFFVLSEPWQPQYSFTSLYWKWLPNNFKKPTLYPPLKKGHRGLERTLHTSTVMQLAYTDQIIYS